MSQLDELFQTMKTALLQITMLEIAELDNSKWCLLMEKQAEVMSIVKELRNSQKEEESISYKEMYRALRKVPFREGYAFESDIPPKYRDEFDEAMSGNTTNRLGAVYWEDFSRWILKVKSLAEKE